MLYIHVIVLLISKVVGGVKNKCIGRIYSLENHCSSKAENLVKNRSFSPQHNR